MKCKIFTFGQKSDKHYDFLVVSVFHITDVSMCHWLWRSCLRRLAVAYPKGQRGQVPPSPGRCPLGA